MKPTRCLCVLALLVICSRSSALTHQEAWAKIAPSFTEPEEFLGKMGAYRSSLLFDDGSEVKTATDWGRRREEILKKWHGLMGAWPQVIEHPKISVIESSDQGDHVRHKVKVQVAAYQWLDGYLHLH